MNRQLLKNLIFVLCLSSNLLFSQTWQSKLVGYQNGILSYTPDANGAVIPDFSYAGYKRSEVPIPTVPVVKTISPIAGDNTASIQAAIDAVGVLPMDNDGIRGALLLNAGVYNVYGTLTIPYSGVVLRGVGNGDDTLTNTVIYGRGNTPVQRSIIIAGGGNNSAWKDSVSGSRVNITSDIVKVGDRKFTVSSASGYTVGDNIIIYHPCTETWLAAINYGGPDTSAGWGVDDQPIVMNRRIMAITGNEITIDAPVYNILNKSLSQSYIYKYGRANIKTNIGVEKIKIDIETLGGVDENHAWTAVTLNQVEDCWVSDCTMIHFGYAAVHTMTATRVTVQNCNALDPISIITGERRYNYCVYIASNMILFKDCVARSGRHHFVSNGHSYVSDIVVLNCKSLKINNSSEGHRRWSQGMLYDNYLDTLPVVSSYVLGLYNRGSMGTSHGWAAVNSVVWNSSVGSRDMIIQKPPIGQNYAIGCFGRKITGTNPPAPFTQPTGYVEGTNTSGLEPKSLFLAQLQQRMSTTKVGADEAIVSKDFKLYPAYPNPFNPQTSIRFNLPSAEKINVSVYGILGNKVDELFSGTAAAGENKINWDLTSKKISSGVYIILLQYQNQFLTQKVTYLK